MLNSAKIITLQNLEDKEENTISIGNSFYTDDIWDMEQYMQDVTLKSGAKKLRFDVFATMEYRKLMKKYAYYKLGRVKPRTVIGYVNGCFPTFFPFV